MATTMLSSGESAVNNGTLNGSGDQIDPFVDNERDEPSSSARQHASHLTSDESSYPTSTSQAKRTIEAHLQETEKRLHQTQKLGTSLLQQQSDLTEKLQELEQHKDEPEISGELRNRLVQLEKEHDDIGREIARALLPKSRVVSAEENPATEASIYSSQATASPTKITAPSRRQRNQPASRAGDLQFAADISTSLLAQVRQLQAAIAERDEIIKNAQVEQSRSEHEAAGLTQRLRTLDENEQRYKDDNWNLETQNHQLLAATREASEREKKLSATVATALADKTRLQNEIDEIKLAHGKLSEDHAAAKKAHDTELHTLKRTVDLGDSEKISLQSKVEELTAQNQELAQAINARFRGQQTSADPVSGDEVMEDLKDLSTPEHSPPPSPTKATPRHPGLESETLRSSLHHAHRMIQNLKSNIHREKTEKIELKRMLQDAQDELEQRRGDPGSGSKRLKTKPDILKKAARPEMLGGGRRARTDVEIEQEGWEDHDGQSPSRPRRLAVPGAFNPGGITDTSDAYQTSTDVEGAFETADEKHGTESEDFQTGAESLAGDSTDDLTETEDTGSKVQKSGTIRGSKPTALAFKNAGDRTSFISTASTSAGEEDDDLQTPVQPQSFKFRLKNGRQSLRQSRQPDDGTPNSTRSVSVAQASSPATVTDDRSPPAVEQSLYAELGDFDEMGSDRFGTPGRASIASTRSTPHNVFTPSKRSTSVFKPTTAAIMVDAAVMTDPWQPEREYVAPGLIPAPTGPSGTAPYPPSPSDFPLPPSVPVSPIRKTDTSTQYTPQRSMQDSPSRNTATFITPPKTVWDEAHESELASQGDATPVARTPTTHHEFSTMLTHETAPISPVHPTLEPQKGVSHNYSGIQTLQSEPLSPKPDSMVPSAVVAEREAEGQSRPKTAEKVVAGAAGAGLLASAASVLGWNKSKSNQEPVIAEDETSTPAGQATSVDQSQMPLTDISENAASGRTPSKSNRITGLENAMPFSHSSNDQGSQTLLTSDEIERALKSNSTSLPAPPAAVPLAAAVSAGGIPPIVTRNHDVSTGPDSAATTPLTSPIKRPASASSHRSSVLVQQHPPLPQDHRTAIEKAGGRVTSPAIEFNSSHVAAIMGPPMMPASAMRRPRTPGESSVRSPTRESAALRGSYTSRHQRQGTVGSQLSRKSSVSSFASELDERFNIRPEAPTASHSFEASPGTDPRMIQAITQTMIGEFLWKYTRKAGRSDFSATRHRRYFWVHPYTKTLYWSDQDPQTAGRNELKAKSVAIEAVRVVTDENPMPPGLHRKSLEVVTPGRKVKFTASTGQRHETWFNALSYLLLRGEHDPNSIAGAADAAAGHEITRDDINEFNVSGNGYGARLVPKASRVSMSSYNSRTTRGTSTQRTSVRQSQVLEPSAISRSQPQQSGTRNTARLSRAEQPREADKDRTARAGSMSRFSRLMGSVTGRTSRSMSRVEEGKVRSGDMGSIYDASVVSDARRDSAEEMRKEMLRQEQEGLGGLENIRACCGGKSLSHSHDHPGHLSSSITLSSIKPHILTNVTKTGKHDVSTLSHSHSHASRYSHNHRGMSLRGTANRKSTAGP